MPLIQQEALRLKEKKLIDEVVAVSAGPQQVQVRLVLIGRHAQAVLTAVAPTHYWLLRH